MIDKKIKGDLIHDTDALYVATDDVKAMLYWIMFDEENDYTVGGIPAINGNYANIAKNNLVKAIENYIDEATKDATNNYALILQAEYIQHFRVYAFKETFINYLSLCEQIQHIVDVQSKWYQHKSKKYGLASTHSSIIMELDDMEKLCVPLDCIDNRIPFGVKEVFKPADEFWKQRYYAVVRLDNDNEIMTTKNLKIDTNYFYNGINQLRPNREGEVYSSSIERQITDKRDEAVNEVLDEAVKLFEDSVREVLNV